MLGEDDTDAAFRSEFERGRGLRRRLAAQVAPAATSVDGRDFSFEAPVGMSLQPGGYLRLHIDGAHRLGQIRRYELQQRPGPEVSGVLPDGSGGTFRARLQFSAGVGSGVVLDGDGPFHDVDLEPAPPEQVAAFLASVRPSRARLRIGGLTLAPGVDAELDAGGFSRHTFLCGQSGSGKSYSMGLLVEQLLLHTDLPVIVLDPNSDCTRLAETRPDADPATAARWAEVAPRIEVRSATRRGPERLRLRFLDLASDLQAAVAGLDALRDRDEYGAMLTLAERDAAGIALDDLDALMRSDEPGMRSLALRVRNLRLTDWALWTRDREDSGLLADLARDDWRCMVVDLGSVSGPEERTLVAAAVLEHLWERRLARRPVLIVIDEAHNICPAAPSNPLLGVAARAAVRIAAEGRKFGLHLLVATQRPQKVDENVLSQCDNLILMRMNSAGDLDRLGGLFSYAPAPLLERSTSFRLGEALVAGKVVPHPLMVRFGSRVSQEGGADPPAAWAAGG